MCVLIPSPPFPQVFMIHYHAHIHTHTTHTHTHTHTHTGYCQRCTKPVIGMDSGCFALDCVYHLQCFTCSKCCESAHKPHNNLLAIGVLLVNESISRGKVCLYQKFVQVLRIQLMIQANSCISEKKPKQVCVSIL